MLKTEIYGQVILEEGQRADKFGNAVSDSKDNTHVLYTATIRLDTIPASTVKTPLLVNHINILPASTVVTVLGNLENSPVHKFFIRSIELTISESHADEVAERGDEVKIAIFGRVSTPPLESRFDDDGKEFTVEAIADNSTSASGEEDTLALSAYLIDCIVPLESLVIVPRLSSSVFVIGYIRYLPSDISVENMLVNVVYAKPHSRSAPPTIL